MELPEKAPEAAGPRRLNAVGMNPVDIVAALGLAAGQPVLVVIGGADSLDAPSPKDPDFENEAVIKQRAHWRSQITNVLELAVRPLIRTHGIVILTGGTSAGIMNLVGETLADMTPALVGVSPAATTGHEARDARLEPHHHAVVETRAGDWGSETETLFEIAEAVTGGTAPGLVLLANGGSVSRQEADRFLRGGWPVAVLPGTGRTADTLATAARTMDETLWEGIHDADVELLDTGSASEARKSLSWRLAPDDVLRSAWSRCVGFDTSASRLKRKPPA